MGWMIRLPFVLGVLAFGLSFPTTSRAGEEAHFRRLDIPANDARLSELARVKEFRCSGEWPRFSGQTLLIAEYYRNGKRDKVFRLSRAVYDESLKKKAAILSIGWQRDFHRLTSIHENGDFYSPWTESILLPDFSPVDASYFEDSLPEKRKPEREGSVPFKLYPVLGLCGQRANRMRHLGLKDRDAFLEASRSAGAKDALMIYLYQSEHGEEPALQFEKEGSFGGAASVSPTLDVSRKSPAPLAYKDAETGILFYVESDGRHVAALSPEGKVLWRRDPFVDAKLEPYRVKFPVIVCLVKPHDWMVRDRKGAYICIGFNSSQCGIMDFKKGDFIFMGQN